MSWWGIICFFFLFFKIRFSQLDDEGVSYTMCISLNFLFIPFFFSFSQNLNVCIWKQMLVLPWINNQFKGEKSVCCDSFRYPLMIICALCIYNRLCDGPPERLLFHHINCLTDVLLQHQCLEFILTLLTRCLRGRDFTVTEFWVAADTRGTFYT